MRLEEKSIIKQNWSDLYVPYKTKICHTMGKTGCAKIRVHKFWSSFMTNYNYERQ